MSSNDFDKRPIIVMDWETTGIDPEIHDIIEMGAIEVDSNLNFKRAWERRIQIQNPTTVQQAALDVNGYTPERWKHALPLAAVIPQFQLFAQDGIFCAWNITFEYRFLMEAYRRIGRVNPFLERRYSHHLDIPSMAWHHFKGQLPNISYDAFAERLGIPPEKKPHQAIMGAFHNLQVLRALRSL